MALGDLVTEDRDKITGQRVLVCLGVGGIVAYLDPEILATIKSLGPAVGCGTGAGAETGEPSPFSQGNPPSHGTDEASCENDGLYDGKNNPFSQELYEMCGDTYYDSFIEGCMSVEGNTRDECEQATDAE